MPRHVVLLSGGLDSTVACALACFRDGPHNVTALGIAYGQRHINELSFARLFAGLHGIRYVVGHVDPAPWKTLPLMTGTTSSDRSLYAMQSGGVSDAYLPARNVAFLAMALMVAGVQNARTIWIGANADDYAGFPDCREPFLYAWQQMASLALDRTVTLETPLLKLSKREIVQLARQMGLNIALTWSCYRPQYTLTGADPCHRCDACRIRDAALEDDAHAA